MTIALFSQAFARKWKALASGVALSVALSSTGCCGPSHTEDGLIGGAVVGGILGTLFGIVTHHPAAGLAIGAASGAAVGGVTGAAEDHAERKAVQQAVAEQQRRMLTLQDIANLTANGTSDAIIINQIRASGAVYALDAPALQYLHDTHVSEAVIAEMQATATRPQGVVVQPVERVYVPEPYYGPPVVGVRVYGGGYRHW
jgi:hypothetical protein